MEKVKITFLGTSNAIPTVKRSHTAILLTYKNENILVDCGEGAQRQFKFAHLSPSKLTRLLITHWHGDHILGIPGLFQTLAMSDYQKTLEVYGPRNTERFLSSLQHIFKLKIKTKVKEVFSKFYEGSDFYLEAASMKHDTHCLAYSFIIKEKHRLDKKKLAKLKLPNSPLLKQLQESKSITFKGRKIKSSQVSYLEKGRKITFILDTAPNPASIQLAKNSDILVCESSFSNQEAALAKERLHLTAKDAATIAKKAKVKKLILTHISQRYEHNPKIILDEAKKVFKNTTLAKDFDVVEF
ncbi:MAG: ribonuclease Z [Nanoarchaeota archaeon]|nr:ribonuclease Z [Nanoarchaeota archaeon]MBU1052059.1 ribonuclease Z [Nanoarchaeota archaeon]MBU1988536.1 ribonuclease Z [Nanoarchaeota archaeon]